MAYSGNGHSDDKAKPYDDQAASDTSHHSEKQASLLLDEHGVIQACSGNCQSVLGYRRSELLFRHISMLVPQFAVVPLFVNGHLNPLVGFLGHCDLPFLVQHSDGHTFRSRLSFVDPHHMSSPSVRVLIAPQQPGRPDARTRPHARR